MALASRGPQHLGYASLQAALELASVRALEDLVIAAIYAGLLTAKLDTAAQAVDVSSTAGRDVAPDDVAAMVATLRAWSRQCDDVAADIDAQVRAVHREELLRRREADEHARLVAARRDQLKAGAADDKGAAGKGKRVISESAEDGRGYVEDDDGMDLDDASYGEPGSAAWGPNAGRRRTKGRFGGILGNKRR